MMTDSKGNIWEVSNIICGKLHERLSPTLILRQIVSYTQMILHVRFIGYKSTADWPQLDIGLASKQVDDWLIQKVG